MLYQVIYDKLLTEIQEGKYPEGSKIPSVEELCQEFDVSAITVRRAMNMLKDNGYVIRQPRIGTTVVRTSPSQSSSDEEMPFIGLIITDFDDTFGTHIIKGALDEAVGKAHIIVKQTHGDAELEKKLIDATIQSKAQGVILLPCNSDFIPHSVLDLVSEHFPITIVDRKFEGVPVATITSDNIGGAMKATEYLFKLGHRHVAFIRSDTHVSSNDERRYGWQSAHAHANIALDDSLDYSGICSTTPGSQALPEQDIEHLITFIESHRNVTAFLVGEYNIALLLYQGLQRIGKRVPEDASIICFDHPDAPFDSNMFRFTHVSQNQNELGSNAVRSILSQIQNHGHSEKTVIPTSFILEQSTADISKKTKSKKS